MTLPPATLPLVTPVDEPAGASVEPARRDPTAAPESPVVPDGSETRHAADVADSAVAGPDPATTGPPVEAYTWTVSGAVTGTRTDESGSAPVLAGSAPAGSEPATSPTPAAGGPSRRDGRSDRPPGERSGSCTTAQLRRFIKSRAYVPMHEIRRRFLITSEDDDVTGVTVDGCRIFVGLPEREGVMLGDLLRSGEIGYELQLDPRAPVVVGVYPMRPVSRT